ncbi:hypothetical protein Rhal01_03832 [Rubritalea halochordaticola]|uniref:Uncharacterized protein n=1 Tax=Rubritalea halochordaticola TaxID=714537 RepID=A0ABP9V4P9_9BACT
MKLHQLITSFLAALGLLTLSSCGEKPVAKDPPADAALGQRRLDRLPAAVVEALSGSKVEPVEIREATLGDVLGRYQVSEKLGGSIVLRDDSAEAKINQLSFTGGSLADLLQTLLQATDNRMIRSEYAWLIVREQE